jgi:Family of unknown function (DUF5329)
MNRLPQLLMTSLLGLAALLRPAQAQAQESGTAIAAAEVNHLLTFVATSGCAFRRNGTWYDEARAEAHLRFKYQSLLSGSRAVSAETFIDRAASTSSLSGRPYEVRCRGGATILCRVWLRDELAHFRASAGTPRTARGVP